MPKIDFGFTPSIYQQKIFDFVQHGVGNAVVRARAGAAKSSSMVAAMKLVPESQRCLFIAFNKSIVEELGRKLEGHTNCTVKTVHSLGYSIVKANLETEPILEEYKYRNYLKNNICSLTNLDCDTLTRADLEEYADTITTLVNFARYNLCQTPKEIARIAKKYDIPFISDECEVTIKLLKWGKEHTEIIDYMDMVWLPYELSMKPIGNQYDWIFMDEAQDFSKAYVDLFLRCFKRGTRFVAVLDENQSINQFSGASSDATLYLSSYPHTQQFSLPICYRCDRNILALSKDYVPDILPRDDAGDGIVLYDCSTSEIHDGDMVLCRSRAPLLKLYNKFIKAGRNCYVKGSDGGTKLAELVNSVDAEKLSPDLLTDGLFIRLYNRMLNERNMMMRNHGLDIWDASLSINVMNMYDNISTLRTLSEGCKNKQELLEKIERIFLDDSKGICLSTIHKAKGLESDNVFIICRSTMPPKRAKRDWEMEEERNLIYVAYTRAKHKLGFVSEKEVPPAGLLLDDETIMNDMAYIEQRVCTVLNKKPVENNSHSDFARFRLMTATEIPEKETDGNSVTIEKSKPEKKQKSLDDLLLELE